MNFFFRHLNRLIYLVMIVAAFVIGSVQAAKFYESKKFIPATEEVGFISLSRKNVILKSYASQQQSIPDNGTPLYSGDQVLTYDQVADLEFVPPFDKVRLLPYSDAIVVKRNKHLQVFINEGDVAILSRETDQSGSQSPSQTNVEIYKKGKDGQYDDYQPSVSNLVSGKYLRVTDIQQRISPQGPKLQLKWDATKIKTNAWVELWIGDQPSRLSLYKTYPFELGKLSELISTDHFFWSMRLKDNDHILETSPVSFWKNEYVSQVNLLYPNDEEVINDTLRSENLTFKWAQAFNVSNPVLKIYKDEAQTQLVNEVALKNQNFAKYTPPEYGRYFWKVSDDTQRIQSELRSFYYAPIVSITEQVTEWDSTCEDQQFYYDQPILFLKWNKKYPYPINQYKISLQYFQQDPAIQGFQVRNENIFTEKSELFFKVRSVSPIKVKIQAYNSKMQRLGKSLEKTIELSPRLKRRLLVFNNEKLKDRKHKKTFVSDRNYGVSFEPSSMSALYQYNYKVTSVNGQSGRTGSIFKGQVLSLRGLPIDYYKLEFSIEPRRMNSYMESQYLPEEPKRRAPASASGLKLTQSAQIKLIPPVDFNIEQGSVIIPKVQDVQLKE